MERKVDPDHILMEPILLDVFDCAIHVNEIKLGPFVIGDF